jgi:hypothetical protein
MKPGYICFPVASIVSSYASFSSLISPASATNVSFPSLNPIAVVDYLTIS